MYVTVVKKLTIIFLTIELNYTTTLCKERHTCTCPCICRLYWIDSFPVGSPQVSHCFRHFIQLCIRYPVQGTICGSGKLSGKDADKTKAMYTCTDLNS